MNNKMPPPGFESETRIVALGAIIPLKALRAAVKQSHKYAQIASSIHEIGMVECPVVVANPQKEGTYYLLDGLLRIEIARELGWTEVECLVATDDEAYTYNKRISRLSAVQEHKMVVRAIEQGAHEDRLARALRMDVSTVRRRFRMLDGICDEVVELLADGPCPKNVFEVLKKMKPMRQIEATKLMIGQKNYSSGFVKTILAATPDDQLVLKRAKDQPQDISREQIARLERELSTAQKRTKYIEESYGEDVLELTIAKAYLSKWLKRPSIVRWLEENQPEYLAEFQEVAEMTSLASSATSLPAN
ncbi:plasmid partitioning protein RepB C-terminal domain-containing protein [Dyella sp. 2RAF44]|uniref:plasmid partitioning protein RepB C-terminal domain-containing protein n=1 Tax=Dyella sp. 2RAF44 TaxID=3233000 RepID=UPI003F9010E1